MCFFKWDAKIIKDGLLQMGKTNGKLGTVPQFQTDYMSKRQNFHCLGLAEGCAKPYR